jgi:hypothetical protein
MIIPNKIVNSSLLMGKTATSYKSNEMLAEGRKSLKSQHSAFNGIPKSKGSFSKSYAEIKYASTNQLKN